MAKKAWTPQGSRIVIHRAKEPYKCHKCIGIILRGESYYEVNQRLEKGKFRTLRFHLACFNWFDFKGL